MSPPGLSGHETTMEENGEKCPEKSSRYNSSYGRYKNQVRYTDFPARIIRGKKAEVMNELEAYLVGAEQRMKGEGRAEALDRFLALLNSLNPEGVKALEERINSLHGIEKFQRFRMQLFLILLDVFQGGMHFALSQKAMDNQWDLLKVLGLAAPESQEEKQANSGVKK